MDGTAPSKMLPDTAALLHTTNSTSNETLGTHFEPQLVKEYLRQPILRNTVGAIILAYYLYRCIRYFTSELPPFGSGLKRLPGPRSTLPYVGRVHDVDRMQAWTAFNKFSKQYDGLFACTLGGETHIWVAREDVAQDLLVRHASISSARADLGAFPGVTEDYKYLPLLGFTETFHRQRRFADWIGTYNVNNKFQGYIGLEMKKFMHDLISKPHDFHYLTHLFCGRISSRLAYGAPDSAPEHVWNAGTFIGQLGPSGPHTNLLPFLSSLPTWLVQYVPGQIGVINRQAKEAKLWPALYDQTKEALKAKDFPKTYVAASLQAKEKGNESKPLFADEHEAKYAVGMLCIVAIYTIGGPATLFALAMLFHPEWQQKVREEIDRVVSDEMIDLKHSPLLPTLRAAIKESIRWKSTVPLGVPRLLAKNYSYDGYHFPKGGVVHVLDIAMSQDAKRYRDPMVYNPGRWLDESSPNFKPPLTVYPRLKGHHIFGRGKRACPGQDLAEAELLVFCGNLIKFFIIEPTLSEKGEPIWPDPERWTTDVIGGPLPFKCEFKIRDAAKLGTVERMYREAFVDTD